MTDCETVQPGFEAVLIKAVQEGLDSISPSCADLVLSHLRKNTSVRVDQITLDPEAFDDGLKEIFGCGAEVIEKKILERLYIKLEAPQKIEGDFKFAEEVKRAQRLMVSNGTLVAEVAQ